MSPKATLFNRKEHKVFSQRAQFVDNKISVLCELRGFFATLRFNLLAICLLLMASCEKSFVEVSRVALDYQNVILDIGGSQTLTAAVFPDDASDKTVYWASSHPNVATVENGKITAVSGGSAIIRVSTKNGNQRGDCVAVVTSAPANVKAAAFLGRQVDLSWNEIKEARSYHIYRSSSAEGTYSKLDNTATASYRDINPLTGNGEYNFYKISAVYDKEREGPKSDYATGAPPNKPTGFKAEKSGTYIYLSWDYAIDAGRYFIYRRNSAEEEYVKTGESGSSPFYDNSPTKGNNYYYKVSAVNPFDESEPSNPDFCEF